VNGMAIRKRIADSSLFILQRFNYLIETTFRSNKWA